MDPANEASQPGANGSIVQTPFAKSVTGAKRLQGGSRSPDERNASALLCPAFLEQKGVTHCCFFFFLFFFFFAASFFRGEAST